MFENHGQGSEPSARNGNGAVPNGARGPQRSPVTATSNGVSKPTAGSLNGSSQNGKELARASQPSTYYGHDREEMTRLVMQALSEMGYQEAAASVSRDSGIELENSTVVAFRAAILEGAWGRAEQLLNGAVLAGESQEPSSGNGLVLAPNADKNEMRFGLRRQKYLELLQLRETAKALVVLRTELTPLCQERRTLQSLAGLLMCRDSEELMTKASWDGSGGQSRPDLLSSLSKHISPSVMLPDHRLGALLQQVKSAQLNYCVYHTNPETPSLYADHVCQEIMFPAKAVLELNGHGGEVWNVVFSHDGTKMASCGSDLCITIWSIPTFKVLHKIPHGGDLVPSHDGGFGGVSGVCTVAWSPDDSMLVTCGRDNRARVWNFDSGSQRAQFNFTEPVTSCVWAPNGEEIILGTLSLSEGLCQWNLDGELLYTWTKEHRIEDLAISPDGRRLVATAFEKRLLVFNYPARELETEIDLDVRPTSISICEESRFLLANQQQGEALLIELASGETRARYSGHKGGDFAIRSGFGGANENYVVSGSEDGFVYIWHKWTGFLIKKMFGHVPRVNAVSWNPKDPCMFASCGDDGKIKIWSNPGFYLQRSILLSADPASMTGEI